MIQPLRRWHQHVFSLLALVLPVLFSAALTVRPSAPVYSPPPRADGDIPRQSRAGWKSYGITIRVRNAADNRTVELVSDREILEPDLLVYIVSAPAPQSLTDDAVPLGPFRSGGRYILPPQLGQDASIVLYSGARREVLDSAPLGVVP